MFHARFHESLKNDYGFYDFRTDLYDCGRFMGFAAALKFPELATPDLATPTLLSSGVIPPVLSLIVMIGIMAAAISTIDSILLSLSSLFARDVYRNLKPEVTDRMQLAIGKLVIPVIALLAFLFAKLEINLIAVLSVASSAGLLVTVPAIIGTFLETGNGSLGFVSVIVGTCSYHY